MHIWIKLRMTDLVWIVIWAIFVWAVLGGAKAWAQNTGGVFPPTVNQGHESLQLRVAVNPDRDDDVRHASRLHYQKAVNGDLMWRIVGQIRNTAENDVDFDFLQGEVFYELSDNDDRHQHGFRFDARLRPDSRAEQLGLNFINQFDLGEGWRLRALALTAVELGSTARDGVNLQSRFQISRRLQDKKTIGVELFNNYGNTGSIGSLRSQSHTIGPFFATPLANNVSLFLGPLFGLTQSSPDVEARLWLTRSF